MSNFIITWQIATACMVLGGCAVMGYYLYAFNNQNEYYDRAQYTGVNFTFSPKAHPEPAIRAALARRIVQELEQDPSIDNVALTNEYYNSTSGDSRAWIEGVDYASENDVPLVCRRIVSPGYFAATNIPILIGRGFDDNDGLEHPVAVVTEEFARRYYGSTDALGCRFRFGRDWQQYTIVGIVPDVFRNRFFPDRPTGVFVPYACENWMDMILIAKTGNLSAADAERRITEILGSLDPRLSIAQVTPLDHMHSLYQGGTIISFVFMLFSVCGVAALIMAAAGLFGIISFQVNIRRLEIGIRMALGESPSGAVMLIMRRGLMCVTAGLLLGSVGTYLIRYIIASSDAEMPENPWLYVAGLAIMLSISLASMFLPAAKAASEDPCKALHEN
jgi:ABC-type antimicrobial peptide transport system permease subunit